MKTIRIIALAALVLASGLALLAAHKRESNAPMFCATI